jgi:hypothetical protein
MSRTRRLATITEGRAAQRKDTGSVQVYGDLYYCLRLIRYLFFGRSLRAGGAKGRTC